MTVIGLFYYYFLHLVFVRTQCVGEISDMECFDRAENVNSTNTSTHSIDQCLHNIDVNPVAVNKIYFLFKISNRTHSLSRRF